MSSNFVPYLAAVAANRSTLQRAAQSGGSGLSDFKPIGETLPRREMASGTVPALNCSTNSHSSTCSSAAGIGIAPKITVHRDGDRIDQIRIECGCGEIIELVCSY